MSHQHTDRHDTGDEERSSNDSGLEQFTRNRFFSDKLLSARDLRTEQSYHANRLETLAQHVIGEGVVCGLAVTIETNTRDTENGDASDAVADGIGDIGDVIDDLTDPTDDLTDPTDDLTDPADGIEEITDGVPDPIDVDAPDPPSGDITITLEPGVAIDNHGRIIVVPGAETKTITDTDAVTDGFSLFVELDPTETEPAPKPGTYDACVEDCEYSRVVEGYTIRLEPGPPAERKPVPDVDFPTKSEMEATADETAGSGTNPAKSRPALSFNRTVEDDREQFTAGGAGGDPAVFLGYFEWGSDADGEWAWRLRDDSHPRHFVYTNDLLYAAILDHATDLENPHDTLVSVDGVSHVDGNVELVSDDDTITSAASGTDAPGAVSLQLADDVQAEIETLARYVRDKSLKYTIEAFYGMAETYANIESPYAGPMNREARYAILVARDALEEGYFHEESAFVAVVALLAPAAQSILDTIDESAANDDPMATEPSAEDFEASVERLLERLPDELLAAGEDAHGEPDGIPEDAFETIRSEAKASADDVDSTALAVALDFLAETATWLEPGENGATMTLPGGDDPVAARIIRSAIDGGSPTVTTDEGTTADETTDTSDPTADETTTDTADTDTDTADTAGPADTTDGDSSSEDTTTEEDTTDETTVDDGFTFVDRLGGLTRDNLYDSITREGDADVISLDGPSEYTIGAETTVHGTASGDVDEVVVFARGGPEGDWGIVELDDYLTIPVTEDDSFEAPDLVLPDGAGVGNRYFARAGEYELGVIDVADLPGEFGYETVVPASDFEAATTDSQAIAVGEP